MSVMPGGSHWESSVEKSDTGRRLGSIACAMFFIWVGIAMLGNFP